VRYRALVIGGNTNGVAGFGIAKGLEPTTVAGLASKMSKRNIFFVERHLNNGLTRDLVGRHNSCKVYLRATTPGRGLVGHPLILEILKRIGISDCTAKSHGNRNVFNVVRATFKALQTHESLEEIARKRGRRLVNLERNKHLAI
jgi:small subunit ribosomal protein S5